MQRNYKKKCHFESSTGSHTFLKATDSPSVSYNILPQEGFYLKQGLGEFFLERRT